MVHDKTWELTIKVRITTLSGWEPDLGDVETWLDDGGTLELVSVEKCKEVSNS